MATGEDILKNTAALGATGAKVGSTFGPQGTLIGAGVGAATGLATPLWQKMIQAITGFSEQRALQQKVLNKMVADGYEVAGKVPGHLKLPPETQQTSGVEASVTPKPQIYFDSKVGGAPMLAPYATGHLRPSSQQNLPQVQAKPGGFGAEAPFDQTALDNLNNAYYNEQPANFSDLQKRLYPDVYKNVQPQQPVAPGQPQPPAPQIPGQGSWTNAPAPEGSTPMPQTIERKGQGGSQGGSNDGGSFWSGRKAFNEQVPLNTPLQQTYQENILRELSQNPASFEPIRQNEIRRFHEETAPQIAEQYFGRNPNSFSSAYPEALGRGGANLSQRLAAMQSQYNLQREGNLQNIAMRPSFTTVQHQAQPGFADKLLEETAPSLIKYGGQLASDYFGKKQTPAPQQVENPNQQLPSSLMSGMQKGYNQYNNQAAELSQLSGNLSSPFTPRNPYEKLLQDQLAARNKQLGGGR